MCISIFFAKIIERVTPYIVRANAFVRTLSGILSRKQENVTIVPGFMDYDPKMAAKKSYLAKK